MIKKALLAALVGSVIACSAAPVTEDLGSSASSIIKGTSSDASQDSVVLIMIYDENNPDMVAFCSGTLLTSQLVLTARHCVSKTDESVACDENGDPVSGGVVYSDNPVSFFYVFVGSNFPDLTGATFKPDALVKKVRTDGSKTLCNHDIGLLELDRQVPSAKIMQIRLDGTVAQGDKITAVGWGVTDTTQQPAMRQQRTGVTILDVGPANTTDGPISSNEFQVGESICSGDSGGPAIASTGALVGVVSRGGNGTDPSSNPAAACEGANTYNLYTRPGSFKDTIVAAATDVGAVVWEEGQPDPRLAANGATCAADADCQSAHCLNKVCAADCSATACASGYACNAQKLCVKSATAPGTTTTKSGCAQAPGSATESPGLLGSTLAFALFALGRKRSAKV